MTLEQGEVFAGYTIVRKLGAGGMGEVYLAQHPRLPRQDAIKVLPPHLASDEAFRLRFLREADLAAGLNHPNIVGVLDRGEDDGRLWLSMPYVEGSTPPNACTRVLAVSPLRGRGDHQRHGVGAGLRAPTGRAPPRCETGQRTSRRITGAPLGFRDSPRRRRHIGSDSNGNDHRLGRVRRTGATPRRARRPRCRRLLIGRHRIRSAHGPPAVRTQ